MAQADTATAQATQIKIVFGGGGDADDEHEVLKTFAAWVHERVLYVPIAMDPPYEPLLTWAVEALGSVGIRDIAMAYSPDLLGDQLTTCQGVFIGGGNVYSLLHRLRSTQADRRLRAFVEGGHPLYGGSAGALILGRDIDTARHVDPNDVGLVDRTGLDLALGYALWCHYVVGDDPLIHDYVEETGNTVLAIPERGGVARNAQAIRVLGPEPSRFFGIARSGWLQPGDAAPVVR